MYTRVKKLFQKPIHMNITTDITGSSYDPNIFGPALWFSIHNATTNFPIRPTPFIQQSMKLLILNFHLLIPCPSCKEHFTYFVQNSDLNLATSSRENLFTFFVNLHNHVNLRLGKPQMSIDEAKSIYGFNNGLGSNVRISFS